MESDSQSILRRIFRLEQSIKEWERTLADTQLMIQYLKEAREQCQLQLRQLKPSSASSRAATGC